MIITVSMVKNEEDIIESSVRYWLTFSDRIIIFDHYSNDATSQILSQLQNEFPDRLILFQPEEEIEEYNQAQITNEMIRCAFTENNANLVLPLDADEFPYMTGRKNLRGFLDNLHQKYCYSTLWMPFAPLHKGDKVDKTKLLPLSFYRKKTIPIYQWLKMILTRETYLDDPIMIGKGNHTIYRPSGNALPDIINVNPDLYYAHYMYRNYQHFVAKVINNWIACRNASDWQPGIAEHYRLAYERIKKGRLTESELDYYALSVSGMTGETIEDIKKEVETIEPAIKYGQIRLKYTK